VTNREFEQFLHQTGGLIPQHWVGGKVPPGKEYHPVTGVSWHDAARYADWCGKRLPTKWEWEKAAGGPDGLIYAWGNAFKAEACHSLLSSLRETMPVHAHPEGVSPYGGLDMCGNTWEWTVDTITRVEEETIESFRIIKGGSFYCGPLGLRVGAYSKAYDRMKDTDLGFRCVMDVAEGVGPVIMPTKPGDAVSEAEAARRAEALRLPQHVPTPVPVRSDSATLAATAAYPPTQAPMSGSSRRTVVASDSGGLGELADSSSDIHSSPTLAMAPSDSGSGSGGSSGTAAISDMDTIAMSPQEAAGGSDPVGTQEAMGVFDGVGQQGAPPPAPPPSEPLPPDAAAQDVFGAETMAIPPADAQARLQQESPSDSEVVDMQLGAGADATQAQTQPQYDEYQQPQPGYEGYQHPQPGNEAGQQQPEAGADIFGDETMAIPSPGATPDQGGMDTWGQPQLSERDTQEIPLEPDGVVDLTGAQAPEGETQEMPQMQEEAWDAPPPGETDIFGSETMAIPPRPDDGSGAPIDLQPTQPAPGYGTEEPTGAMPPGYGTEEPTGAMPPGYGTEEPTGAMPPGYGTEEQTGAMPPGETDIFGSETMAIPPRPDDGSGAPIDLQPTQPPGVPGAEQFPGQAVPGQAVSAEDDIFGSETMAIPPRPDDGSGAPIDLQPTQPPGVPGAEQFPGQAVPGQAASAEDDIFGSETMAIPPRPDDGSGAPIDLLPKPPEGEQENGEPPGWDAQTEPPPG
jgi:hypothetical protein